MYPTNYFTENFSQDSTGATLSSEAGKLPILENQVMKLEIRVYDQKELPIDTFNSIMSDKSVMYLTYCALFDDRFVISGTYYDARMFYVAYQARNDRLKSFKVTFPTVVQQPMENVITEMYRSFTGERPKSKAIAAECKPYKT